MKKIGYVYKYSSIEKKGILVWGTLKQYRFGMSDYNLPIYYNLPIKFISTDLLSEIKTGQLVYFNHINNKATNIERASLSNFDQDLMNSLVCCNRNQIDSYFYEQNTQISFKSLDDICNIYEINVHDCSQRKQNIDDIDILDCMLEDLFDDDDVGEIISASKNYSDSIHGTNKLNTIDELYDCVCEYMQGKMPWWSGKKPQNFKIDILELSFWVDNEIINDKYFGKNINELKYLYDIFVLRKRFNHNGEEIKYNQKNNCISPSWSLLLSKFSDSDLKEIIYVAPKLQPALPVDFCKKNIGSLSDDYGMPNVDICKLYCLHKISNAKNISDYKDYKHKLYVYSNCNATHREGEGVLMCQMGTRCIKHLEEQLEAQYENIIKYNVIAQLKVLSNDVNVVNEIWDCTTEEFNNIGLFIEKYNNLKNNFFRYNACEEIIESYENLPQLYKDALKTSFLNCANESVISATKAEDITPFRISYHIRHLGDWILESTKQKVKELVNAKFSRLNNLEDLHDAYKADYITSQQYYNRYKQITNNFSISQLLKELYDYKIVDAPMAIQWQVVSNIIKQFGYKSLSSYNYVKIDCYNSICDIRSLLKWLAYYGNLKDVVLKKAEEKICSVLSDDERWTLFEEKIVRFPGAVNIRKRLDEAYKNKSANKKLLTLACFQDVMLSDIVSIKDLSVKLFIADNLDDSRQYLIQQRATGFLKLYLWQKHPSDTYDWNLIKSHLYKLTAEAQIKILRYLFGKMSSGDTSISLDSLYSEFVETTTPACPVICGILYILKAKKNDMKATITSSMVELAIGEELKQRFDFLKYSKELFYPCNGYFAISAIKSNIDYESFNGILTKEVRNNELYYVLHFYESPIDLFGKAIDWLLDSDFVGIAKQVLVRNTNVEVINGKYYIHESQEFFVKQFVIAYHIDDKCGLVSDKERMIELGYLPKTNAYQPLYTNYIKKYEDSDNYICRGGSYGSSDPNNGIPFFWCKKKMCVRRAHFLLPSSEWENYRFADLLFIALGQYPDYRESVWRVNSEISQFICDYTQGYKSSERNICSKPIDEAEERGIWNEISSVYRNIYDDDDDDEYEEDCDDYSYDRDEPTYDRYNGSYAQDEMGYSDDDIDTIFDGDPDAYWNID